jgi:hypothetical protein
MDKPIAEGVKPWWLDVLMDAEQALRLSGWSYEKTMPLRQVRAKLLAALTAAQQPMQQGGGEVVWIHGEDLADLADPNEKRYDTPAFVSLDAVGAEFRAGMIPFVRQPAPPSAPVGVEGLPQPFGYVEPRHDLSGYEVFDEPGPRRAAIWNMHGMRKALAQTRAHYSIDADPDGIRERVADAITGALSFGAQGAHKPPAGHWLEPFWDMARAEREAPSPPGEADRMTAETDLLPLPEGMLVVTDVRAALREYARANLSAALASAQAREDELRAEVDFRDSVIATHAADTREYQKRISQAESRAERLAEALRDGLSGLSGLFASGDYPLTDEVVELGLAIIEDMQAALTANAAQPGETGNG